MEQVRELRDAVREPRARARVIAVCIDCDGGPREADVGGSRGRTLRVVTARRDDDELWV